jgi:hypothetical protein
MKQPEQTDALLTLSDLELRWKIKRTTLCKMQQC